MQEYIHSVVPKSNVQSMLLTVQEGGLIEPSDRVNSSHDSMFFLLCFVSHPRNLVSILVSPRVEFDFVAEYWLL